MQVYPQITTDRIYFLILAVFVLLICILSLYIPVNARAVVSLQGAYKINVDGTTGNLTIGVVSSNNDVVGRMSLYGQPTNTVIGVYDNVSI